MRVKRNRSVALTRFSSGDEIHRLHHALDEDSRKGPGAKQQADIIRLLLLTGCRKSEILRLRWREVYRDTLIVADSKTGPRKVHLNAQARGIIKRQPRGGSTFVFPLRAMPCIRGSILHYGTWSAGTPESRMCDFMI